MQTEYFSKQVKEELDFYRIRETVANLAVSEEGREALLEREPCADKERISLLKDMGREWYTYLHSSKEAALSFWPCVRHNFPLLGIEGAVLPLKDLYALGLFCLAQARAKELIASAQEELSLAFLSKVAEQMPSLKEAEEKIFSVVGKDGEIKDLPSLRAIQSRIASLKKEVQSAIRKYTSDTSLNSCLQSNLPALRDGRELLAVRSDRRGAIKGIVHEISSSGQTLYIEPEEAVRANNELVQEEYRLQEEIRRILRELTSELAAYKNHFQSALDNMLLLDTTYAAARYQSNIRGVFAEDGLVPAIFQARHPLLAERAIPVDIKFLEGKKVLIITGPNTGGKTVTLKTIALFALMNQAGFPLPAGEGSCLPLFTSVFADIGDEQSIDQSLSTFSAHMKKIAEMMEKADEGSLVLLDELASGTDPLEGGAIAMAALDTLLEKKSFVIVTTHHGILKNYGYTNPACSNACVEFSQESLSPTYRLIMGLPGESHALDIALKSGLPADIVQKARGYIQNEQADVSALIKGLSEKHIQVDALLKEEKIKFAELEEKELLLRQRELEIKEKEIALRHSEQKQSFAFLKESRSKLENLVRTIREGEITREKTLAVRSFINELESQIKNREVALEKDEEQFTEKAEKLKKDIQVFTENGMKLSSLSQGKKSSKKKKARLSNAQALKTAFAYTGENTVPEKVLELKEGLKVFAGPKKLSGVLIKSVKKGFWSVQLGAIRMTFAENQIVPQSQESQSFAADKSPSFVVEKESVSSDEKPFFELRLLGMRYEEAIKALEKQLDLCTIKSFKNFSIIHGKGNGVLQQAVSQYLSHYPGVKEFHFAPPEEGGSGKTYVTLF